MKSISCSLVLVMSLVWAAVPATAATKVFLLAGQSNMDGRGSDSELTPPYNAVQPAVKFWNFDNAGWTSLQPGFSTMWPNGFGPEVSFGYALHNTVLPNDDIYLVKYAQNSTTLAVDWNPDGSGSSYNSFKYRVNLAMQNLTTAGLNPQIAGMIWMQGESDAYYPEYAPLYAANLTNFIASVRKDFSVPDMRFVLGRILDSTANGTPYDNGLVRTAEETVPGQVGDAAWIDTDDLQLAYQGHYGTQGQIELGTRFANQFIQTPEPSATVLAATGVLLSAGYWWRRRCSVRSGR